ncbi:CIR protein PIR protein [Plasmodium vinckei vinckei]|uniref:CIR protein PIR protein n=1 Tax=Plasmodium vinckei vinckei TaxID=54757 RepID=A0A449BM98_PLAVN|nr:CIR protein PIR protein [Plasmodium vinckei vinckei]VEV54535.1 CIR protein PIR protein [Plasmodium vinckei vinckei]
MEAYAFNLFREVDELFESKSVNVSKFYNDKRVTQYCPEQNGGYKSCYSDYERINAIGTYVFMELISKNKILNGSNDERHLSYFIMWISHILYRKFENNTFTLNSIYEKHLKNNVGNFNYWNLLQNKKYLTNSNIAIMNILYLLFQQISDTIKVYQTKGIQSHEYTSKTFEFYLTYDKLSKHINRCGPYRELLNHLITTYNSFIKTAKTENIHGTHIVNDLMELSPIEKKFGQKFSSNGCKKIHKKLMNNSSKLIKMGNNMLFDYAKRKIQGTPNSIEPKDTGYYYFHGHNYDDVSDDNDDDVSDDNDDDVIDGDDDDIVDLGNNDIPTNLSNQEQNGQQGASTASNPASEKLPPTPPQAPQKSDASKIEKTNSGTQKGNSDSEGGGSGSGASGTGSGKGDTKRESGSPDSGTSSVQNDQGGSLGGSGSQKDSSNQGGSLDGSKPSRDQDTKHSSGASNGYFPRNWGMSLNLMSYMPSASDIYETPKNILISGTNKIMSAYNSAKVIVQDTYDKTLATVKEAYTASTDYISGAVNSITTQFNPFGTSQLSDDQSGSGGSWNSLQTDNNPLKTPLPPSPSPSITLPLSPSDPQTPPDPSDPKSIDSQTSTTPIQQIAPTDGNIGSQTPPSGQGTLSISGSNPSNTKKENVITVANVKMKEPPSIWCIGPNNKCDITGISIIVISIFTFLVIMYKYLSLGWTSKSKRKKTIKKVINSIGGKRPIQIIIKSHDRNKDLKPVINSVGRKKDPLLNIYKLMQADPVPFINLFFLLIFFVYKRKENFLEL